MREQDKKQLLSLKTKLVAEKLANQPPFVLGVYVTERNRVKKHVHAVAVHNGVVTYKEKLDRKDSLSMSVEKFTRYYELVKAASPSAAPKGESVEYAGLTEDLCHDSA